MKITGDNKLYSVFPSLFLSFFLLTGFACSGSEQATTAQTDKSTVRTKQTVEKDFEFLKLIGDPCRFVNAEGYRTPPDKEIYELQNAGYPKAVTLGEAVAVFNRFAQCHELGKTQPSLRTEEIIGAIAVWNCEWQIREFGEKMLDKSICREFTEIVKTGKLPKGSWIEYGAGCTVCEGYDTDVWEIRLYIKLDKHRRDLKDEPTFSRLIRLNYISSKPIKQ